MSPIGFDQLGITYNLNADDVAGQLSAALQAEKLILMTDVKGLYEVFGREETFIEQLDLAGAKTSKRRSYSGWHDSKGKKLCDFFRRWY